jgi:RNA 2',3'-cyclic 3'-phosphodiesterase
MRLFVALDIDAGIRQKIATFMEGVRGFAPEARWVHPESLHVTLKFIGEMAVERLPDLQQELMGIRAAATRVTFRNYGFFPAARSARVFWVGIEADAGLGALAKAVDEACSRLKIPPEERAFSPHLTLARGKSGAPGRRPDDGRNRMFQRLQEKLVAFSAPEFGTMSPREFFLYESKLSPAGSRYTKLKGFPLT